MFYVSLQFQRLVIPVLRDTWDPHENVDKAHEQFGDYLAPLIIMSIVQSRAQRSEAKKSQVDNQQTVLSPTPLSNPVRTYSTPGVSVPFGSPKAPSSNTLTNTNPTTSNLSSDEKN